MFVYDCYGDTAKTAHNVIFVIKILFKGFNLKQIANSKSQSNLQQNVNFVVS